MVKTITVTMWETTDGTRFADEKKAKDYELEKKIRNLLKNSDIYFIDTTSASVASCIVSIKQGLIPLLTESDTPC